MARLNTAARNLNRTHEGAPAVPALSAEKQLRRSLLSCLLWEDEFYEDGKQIADRIIENAEKVDPKVLASLAVEARTEFNLRHAPLLLLEVLSKTGRGRNDGLVQETVFQVVQRADELAELLAIHWRDGHKMVPAQLRKGLARAFNRFDEYQLAKYDRDGKVKLRDVLRVVRPTPKDAEQSALFKKVKDRTLKTPDTWEVALSGGADKKETFTRLIKEGQLGYFALLRNLRNMEQAKVDRDLVKETILARKNGANRILPFRFIAAARAAPVFEKELDTAMAASINLLPVLSGRTRVLVDVSSSMDWVLSDKSDLTRLDAAAALASVINAEDLEVFTFSNRVVRVPARRGMAGVDAVIHSQEHSGTYLGKAVAEMNKDKDCDRLIVITDEQSHDPVPDPVAQHAYLINVASNKNGVGYGPWTHIDGFSEGVLRYIHEIENVSHVYDLPSHD